MCIFMAPVVAAGAGASLGAFGLSTGAAAAGASLGAFGLSTGAAAAGAASGLSFAGMASGFSSLLSGFQAASPFLSMGTSLASGYMQYQGQRAQQRSQAAYYAYQGQVARNNQILAERQSNLVLAAGESQEAAHRRKVAQIKGAQAAGLSASGVAITEGTSALDILGDTAALGELDSMTIRNNAKNEAYGIRLQALQYGRQAEFMDTASAAQIDFLGPAGSLMETAGTVSDKWYRYKRSGLMN